MKSFRDATTNVLKAFGYVDQNEPGDLERDEPDGFNLERGKYRLDGGTWVEIVPAIADLRALKIEEINNAAANVAAQLTVGYPDFELQTWPAQQAEATAWGSDNTASTPVIDAMAGYRGIDRVLYLQKTLAKVQYFQTASAYLVGTRQKYVDQANAATSKTALNKIVPSFTLPTP